MQKAIPTRNEKGLEPLTFRERKFVDALFLTTPVFNGAEAARKAGFSEKSCRVAAVRLLTKDNVKAEIERLQAEVARESQITRTEWMKLGKAITFHDPGKMYDQLGNPIEIKDLEYGERMSVEGFEFVEDFLNAKDKNGNKSKTACGYTKKFKHSDRHKWFVTMGKVCGFITEEPAEPEDKSKRSLAVVFIDTDGTRMTQHIGADGKRRLVRADETIVEAKGRHVAEDIPETNIAKRLGVKFV